MFEFSCNHLKSSWGRPSQPEKEGRACRGERNIVGILKIKLLRKKVDGHHVGCVGDDGGDISDGGDVEDSHDLPCKLSIHWNVTNACSRTALNTICLVIVADFWFYFKYLRILYFHISQL